MTLSRRKMLALVGGGTVLAATGSAAAFLSTRTPHAALAPWDAAGGYAEPRMRALSYAVLAPNPHNRQPWEVALTGNDTVTIWRDKGRDLPVTDPYGRQLTIGMGCFLEMMAIAAAQTGHGVETDLFPQGEAGPVAVCRFVPGAAAPDPLFAHVMIRRSHKEGFEARPLDAGALGPLAPFGEVATASARAEAIRAIASDAWMIEASTPDAWQESIDLLRIGKTEINASPDGIDVGGPFMESLAAAGLFTREAASDVTNPGTRANIEATADAIAGAPGFVVQTTPGNSRAEQIAAGRAWLRLNLTTAGMGLALRPVSQALQEYPEVAGPYEAIHDLCAPEGGTVQMVGLLGYGALTPRTPRWPLEARLTDAGKGSGAAL